MRCALWIALLALAAPFVAAQDVKYNFDSSADFSKFKTYRWEQHPDSKPIDDLTKKQLKQAFDTELGTKGLSEVSDNTDLVIVYLIATQPEAEITTWNSGWGYGPGWRRGWYGMRTGMSTSTVQTITIGTLDLDMFDVRTKQLVWRGTVSKAIDEKAKPDKQQKNMRKAAQKLLKNYPPKQE